MRLGNQMERTPIEVDSPSATPFIHQRLGKINVF